MVIFSFTVLFCRYLIFIIESSVYKQEFWLFCCNLHVQLFNFHVLFLDLHVLLFDSLVHRWLRMSRNGNTKYAVAIYMYNFSISMCSCAIYMYYFSIYMCYFPIYMCYFPIYMYYFSISQCNFSITWCAVAITKPKMAFRCPYFGITLDLCQIWNVIFFDLMMISLLWLNSSILSDCDLLGDICL